GRGAPGGSGLGAARLRRRGHEDDALSDLRGRRRLRRAADGAVRARELPAGRGQEHEDGDQGELSHASDGRTPLASAIWIEQSEPLERIELEWTSFVPITAVRTRGGSCARCARGPTGFPRRSRARTPS